MGGRAGLEPVILDVAGLERLEHAKGVVDLAQVAGEVVASVHFPQAPIRLFDVEPALGGESLDAAAPAAADLLLRDAAQARILRRQGNVLHIVESAEDVDIAHVAHAGEHGEAYMPVAGFEHAIEASQLAPVVVGEVPVAERVQHRLVVFVYKHHHLLPRGLVRPANQRV